MWFDRYNKKQKIILIGAAVFMISSFILGLIEGPAFLITLVFLITAVAIVTGGIVRIINIIRTPTEEEEPAPPPVPVGQLHQVDNGQNPGQQTVVIVQQPQVVEKRIKGRVWGTLGMLYTAGYALYIQYVLDGANVTNIGEAIGKAAAYRILQPFFYCVLASALLSLVGVIGKNKTCILLALVATVGAVIMFPRAFEILLISAFLFLISYIRMAK